MAELFLGNRVENKMKARGITEEEIRRVILTGQLTHAEYGRLKSTAVFTDGYHWGGKDYPHKEVQVIYVVESWATVVITVISRYGFWEDAT